MAKWRISYNKNAYSAPNTPPVEHSIVYEAREWETDASGQLLLRGQNGDFLAVFSRGHWTRIQLLDEDGGLAGVPD